MKLPRLKKIDLSKITKIAGRDWHPDIKVDHYYLAKTDGGVWYAGPADKEWYGTFLHLMCDAGIELPNLEERGIVELHEIAEN